MHSLEMVQDEFEPELNYLFDGEDSLLFSVYTAQHFFSTGSGLLSSLTQPYFCGSVFENAKRFYVQLPFPLGLSL